MLLGAIRGTNFQVGVVDACEVDSRPWNLRSSTCQALGAYGVDTCTLRLDHHQVRTVYTHTHSLTLDFKPSSLNQARKEDIRLPEKGSSNTHGARSVY